MTCWCRGPPRGQPEQHTVLSRHVPRYGGGSSCRSSQEAVIPAEIGLSAVETEEGTLALAAMSVSPRGALRGRTRALFRVSENLLCIAGSPAIQAHQPSFERVLVSATRSCHAVSQLVIRMTAGCKPRRSDRSRR